MHLMQCRLACTVLAEQAVNIIFFELQAEAAKHCFLLRPYLYVMSVTFIILFYINYHVYTRTLVRHRKSSAFLFLFPKNHKKNNAISFF